MRAGSFSDDGPVELRLRLCKPHYYPNYREGGGGGGGEMQATKKEGSEEVLAPRRSVEEEGSRTSKGEDTFGGRRSFGWVVNP